MNIPFIGEGISKVFSIVDKVVPNSEQNAKLKHDLEIAFIEERNNVLNNQSAVIIKEAEGKGILQRNWRPVTMLVFVYIVFNNYILSPYVRIFFPEFPILPLPPEFYNMLTLGISGYIMGRSAEKITSNLKK